MKLEEHAYLIDHFEPVYTHTNRVRAAHGSAIAKEPHKLNSMWRVKQKEPIENLLSRFRATCGKQRFHEKKYREELSCVIANCLHGKPVLYSRNTKDKNFTTVIDWCTDEGLLFNSIGNQNEYEGVGSWFVPTDYLDFYLASHKIEVALANNCPMLELRTPDPIKPDRWISYKPKKRTRQIDSLSRPVRAFNAMMLDHRATLNDRFQIPYLNRIFNYVYSLGGRFYGATHQTLPKTDRKHILLDGQASTELDYRAIHWAILYSWLDQDLTDDPYDLDGISRDVAKGLMLRLINCGSVASFTRMVTLSGNPKNKEDYLTYCHQVNLWERNLKKGIKAERPKMKPCLEGFIEGVPDGLTGKVALDAILKRHKLVSRFFGKKYLGLELQFIDSQIMGRLLMSCSALDIPVLPIHDSVMCRMVDKDKVHFLMAGAYKKELGFSPIIK